MVHASVVTMALVAALAAAVLAASHPLSPVVALGGCLAWACVTWRWPGLWVGVLPAALPLMNLSPWSGWLAFDEFDLLVLATLAGGYARLAAGRCLLASPGAGSIVGCRWRGPCCWRRSAWSALHAA